MSTPNQEAVNMHKRIAMGEKLDGTSLKGSGSVPAKQPTTPAKAPK